jgi:predicted RNA binding protein YcfA (HicA-like mRNA interferase family)
MKIPQISEMELIKKLRKFGFVVVRQKESPIRLEKNTSEKTIKITIPNQDLLKISNLVC